MESRILTARGRYHNGYNCSQAVFCTYCDLVGMDDVTGYKISEGLGGGIASTRGICGALSALVLLGGMKFSDGKVGAGETKKMTAEKIQPAMKEFEEVCGSQLGQKIKWEEIYNCHDAVEAAARLVEKYIFPEIFAE